MNITTSGLRASATALITLVALAPAAPARAQAEDSQAAGTLAIVGARVYTEPGTVIEGATIVVRDGRVRAIGPNVSVPAGARRIDATGKVVTAGLIDPSTRLGLVEVDLEESTTDGSFRHGGADVVHAAYRAVDGYNPRSVAIPVSRAGGVTSAVTAPVGGLVSGMGAWAQLVDDTAGEAILSPAVAMYASLGEDAADAAGGSRAMAVERLRELLSDASEYARRRAAYERNQTRPFAAERLDLVALGPVVEGRIPLVVRAHRSSDIRAALRLGRELGVKLVIEGGTEAWMLAAELAAARVGVILDPTANLPSSFDRVYVRDDAATVLAAAGVDVALSSLGSASNVRMLRQLAGIAVAQGLSPDAALAAITTVPARLFGLDRGRLRPGAVADLVVWSGDPFELSTRAEHVIIGGKEQSTRTRQSLLFERYRKLPSR
jgi:imidazolonepropionase-like amidohydrolase